MQRSLTLKRCTERGIWIVTNVGHTLSNHILELQLRRDSGKRVYKVNSTYKQKVFSLPCRDSNLILPRTPVPKPICYQLSYPGLNHKLFLDGVYLLCKQWHRYQRASNFLLVPGPLLILKIEKNCEIIYDIQQNRILNQRTCKGTSSWFPGTKVNGRV